MYLTPDNIQQKLVERNKPVGNTLQFQLWFCVLRTQPRKHKSGNLTILVSNQSATDGYRIPLDVITNKKIMKKTILTLIIGFIGLTASAQFVAKMEVKEDIPGICDKNEVYALFPSFEGQDQAICPISKEEILKRLNTEVKFLKDNPKYKDKGMMGLVINCKGEVVQCKMDNKTKNGELDKQIEAVFNSLGDWKAGKLNGKNVDSSRLFSFKIKKGVISFD